MALKVYKSSAGSGKTFTLVLEYLALVIKDPSKYRSILAVTFTNKAANEMKSRVIKALCLLSDPASARAEERSKITNALTEKFGFTERQITENSSIAFSSILHSYGDFNISTIDAFVYGLVQTFTRELGLPSQFEIELQDDQMAAMINHEIISRIGIDEALTDALLSWVLSKMNDDSHWGIENDIRGFIKELLRERVFFVKQNADLMTSDDFNDINRTLNQQIRAFEQEVSGIALKIIAHLNEAGIDPLELNYKTSGAGAILKHIADGDIGKVFESVRLRDVLSGKSGLIPKKADSWLIEAYDQVEQHINALLSQMHQFINDYGSSYTFHLLLRPSLYLIRLSESVRSILQEIVRDQQIVHISEFNKRIASLISSTAVPYIYERIGEKFHHYLIDEFQDTSLLQWRNFLPLIDNSLSAGNANLIVGDAKQAIYRFRGGEVNQFIDLPKIYASGNSEILKDFESNLERNYTPFNLDVNYRSAPAIVDFNNELFDFLLTVLPDVYHKVFENHRQDVKKNEESGLVQIDFFDYDADIQSDPRLFEHILATIDHVGKDGFLWQDIAILVQTNGRANRIAQFLSNQGISVVSSDSLLLSSSSKVRFLISFLVFYDQPWDAVNRLELFHHLTKIKGIAKDRGSELQLNFAAELEEKAAIDYLIDFADFEIELLEGLSCYDMACVLMAHYKLDLEIDPYLVFLLEEIFRFELKSHSGLTSFLNYWKDNASSLSLTLPESVNAVRIMTIHKSKGLEFPVVIYPYADAYLNDSRSRKEWIDFGPYAIGKLQSGLLPLSKAFLQTPFFKVYQDDQDSRKLDLINLLYVVLTRAASRLYIMVNIPKKEMTFSIPVFLRSYLQAKGLWQIDKQTYRFGEETANLKASIQQSDSSDISNFSGIHLNWQSRAGIKPVDTDFLELDEVSPAQHGTAIHAFFADIKTLEDIDGLLRQYQTLGLLNSSDVELISRFSEAAIHYRPLIESFSSNAIARTEASLMARNGDLLRVDRVTYFNNDIIVIDFKTGEQSDKHIKQLRRYKEEIEAIEQKSVQAFLLYLQDQIQLIEV